MADVKLRTLPAGHLVLLRGALDEAIGSLSEIERTPAVKACLADKLLTLAASGEIESVRLSEIALVRVRRSCALCRGCEGVSTLAEQRSSSFQQQLPSRSTNKVSRWN
jgi:hypothetical protein